VKTWSPYYAASNEAARLRDIARNMGRGAAGSARLRVQRGDTTLDLEVPRVPPAAAVDPNGGRHDLPGPAFRLQGPAGATATQIRYTLDHNEV